MANNPSTSGTNGGRFEFEDGGVYCGEWEEGKAHGYGICTGPQGEGEFSGAYNYGFELSGVYVMPRGHATYEGQWQNGKKHGLGVESHSRYIYKGEWTQGSKGRYGVRQSRSSQARYEGTWSDGLQDGYGTETYTDGGIYQGQWLRGMRHGYGVRRSVPFGIAAQYSVLKGEPTTRQSSAEDQASQGSLNSGHEPERNRGGFVLRASSSPSDNNRRSQSEQSIAKRRFRLRLMRKQRSADDFGHNTPSKALSKQVKISGSTTSCNSSEPQHSARIIAKPLKQDTSFDSDEIVDPNVTESYMGEWKNDKRCGYGLSERSDGLKYQGEWFDNKKFGYGLTTLRDGTQEQGKYKDNVLMTPGPRRNALFARSAAKFSERVEAACLGAAKAAQLALSKAETAATRTGAARDRAEQASSAAEQAQEDSSHAFGIATQFCSEYDAGPSTSGYQATKSAPVVPPLMANHTPHHIAPSTAVRSPEKNNIRHSGAKHRAFVPQFEALPSLPSESLSSDSTPMTTPPDDCPTTPHTSNSGATVEPSVVHAVVHSQTHRRHDSDLDSTPSSARNSSGFPSTTIPQGGYPNGPLGKPPPLKRGDSADGLPRRPKDGRNRRPLSTHFEQLPAGSQWYYDNNAAQQQQQQQQHHCRRRRSRLQRSSTLADDDSSDWDSCSDVRRRVFERCEPVANPIVFLAGRTSRWCTKNQLIALLVAINLCLSIVFYFLLSLQKTSHSGGHDAGQS